MLKPFTAAPSSRRRTAVELGIVLGLSLGKSAAYSLVAVIDRLTRGTPLSQQTAQLNTSLHSRPIFDVLYQLMSVVFDLVPVLLVFFLLWRSASPHLGQLDLDGSQPGADTVRGVALALMVGIPGLGLYSVGRTWGLTVSVVPSPVDSDWWSIPILLLSALRSGLVEEVIVVGYLFTRLRQLGWSTWWIISFAALLRGGYHLYQGVGPFIGNVAMGVLFGWAYHRWGRLLPLVIAHTVMDAAVFIGYPLAVTYMPALL